MGEELKVKQQQTWDITSLRLTRCQLSSMRENGDSAARVPTSARPVESNRPPQVSLQDQYHTDQIQLTE